MPTNRNTRQRALCFDAPLAPEDMPRLGEQLAAVADVMRGGSWYTIGQLHQILAYRGIAASEAGISARLRDLRKPPLQWTVERRRIAGGLFEYRVTQPPRETNLRNR